MSEVLEQPSEFRSTTEINGTAVVVRKMVRSSRPDSRSGERDRSPHGETARLRAEVKDLLKEKQHTQHQLDRVGLIRAHTPTD